MGFDWSTPLHKVTQGSKKEIEKIEILCYTEFRKRKFVLHKIPKKEIFILAENEIYVTQVYKKGIRFGQCCPRFYLKKEILQDKKKLIWTTLSKILSKKGNFYWMKKELIWTTLSKIYLSNFYNLKTSNFEHFDQSKSTFIIN